MTAPTLFAVPRPLKRHPARYTDRLLPVFARMLKEHGSKRVLDPMCGTGKVFLLSRWIPALEIEGIELEPEWAAYDERITLGSALALPWKPDTFDAIVVSPSYGNRMADHHEAKDASRRNTYRHALERPLHPDNTGQLQWSSEYRIAHLKAWAEARRVLRPGGIFILNCKDHIRAGEVQLVTAWHISALQEMEFTVLEWQRVPCPGMRYGQHGQARVENEDVVLLKYDTKEYKGERM